MRGNDDRETFVFTVEPFVSGGFLLSIRYVATARPTLPVPGSGLPSKEPSKSRRKPQTESYMGRSWHGRSDPVPTSPETPVNQELDLISRRNRSNRSALVVSLLRSPELMIRNRFNLPLIPCGLPTRDFRDRKIAGIGNKCGRAAVWMEDTR